MFHVELRQFPHNACRFNLDERALQAIVEPWARERVVEVEGRKWSPQQAKLTVLEGPELALVELSMGRGWRAAQRRSTDVTERVLAAAQSAARASQPEAPMGLAAAGGAGDALALGVQIATLLGGDPLRLLEAWREAAVSSPELSPSEALALAERALRADAPQS